MITPRRSMASNKSLRLAGNLDQKEIGLRRDVSEAHFFNLIVEVLQPAPYCLLRPVQKLLVVEGGQSGSLRKRPGIERLAHAV